MSDTRRRRGFTLIEVLVVVAIIALLVAILLPSLTRARESTRATLCGTRIKESLNGTLLHYHETGMRRENWSTNFGWAVYSLKVGKGQPEIFSCPSDENPLPIPAAFSHMFDGDKSRGMTTTDGIFNRIYERGNGQWELDIQDQLEGAIFGGDAYNDPMADARIQYDARKGTYRTTANAEPGNAAIRHEIYSYQGDWLWRVGGGTNEGGPRNVTLMWMSYGVNASAGLKNMRGTPILVAEARKLGLFPERLGGYEADYLQRALRFRHGSRTGLSGLAGGNYAYGAGNVWNNIPPVNNPVLPENSPYRDKEYVSRSRLNAGFFDGHVESITYQQMFMDFDNTLAERQRAVPKESMWIGTRRGAPSF